MWKCSKCGELVESSFEVCWNCQHVREETDEEIASDETTDLVSDSDPYSQNLGEESEAAFLTRAELGAIISRTLACIIFAICIFYGLLLTLIFIKSIGSYPWFGFQLFNDPGAIWPLALMFGLLTAIGLFFWLNAKRIGRKIVGEDNRQISGISGQLSPAFLGTTIQVAGLLLVVDGIQSFASIVYYTFQLDFDTNDFWDSPGIFDCFVSLALGFWMLLGSNGIAKGIKWLRTVGTPLSNHNDE